VTDEHPPEDSYVGRMIAGRYAVVKKLNQGGMGAVYLAIQRPLDRFVAVKVLLKSHAGDPTAARRFEKEARSVSRLTHPHVVTLYDFGETEANELYIAMEYLHGTSLRELLDASGFISWDRSLHIMRGVVSALVAAHGAGIIHRDLKPENVMLVERSGDEDFAKVLDFGLAKSVEPESASAITQRDIIPGTPAYLSPERANGVADDPRSDLYALGAMWFELLVGRPPFEGESSIKVILRHIHEQPAVPSRANPKNPIPPVIDQLVLQLLEKHPDHRPRSAEELLERLETLHRPQGWHVDTPGSLGRHTGADEALHGFTVAVSELDELSFSIEEEEPVPLVQRKVRSEPDPGIFKTDFLPRGMPPPSVPPAEPRPTDEPVLLVRKKPAIGQTPAPAKLRIASIAEVSPHLAAAKTSREVAELCVAFLATRFDRAAVLDLRDRGPQLLAATGIAEAPALPGAVLRCAGLREMLPRRDAYYGPSIGTPDWLGFFRSLGGHMPGALFVATLKRDGAPAFLFYGDHRDLALRPDVRDAVLLLKDAAAAFSIVSA
jgi:serine/threonine protein kinase